MSGGELNFTNPKPRVAVVVLAGKYDLRLKRGENDFLVNSVPACTLVAPRVDESGTE
jgi:hypothetical protein